MPVPTTIRSLFSYAKVASEIVKLVRRAKVHAFPCDGGMTMLSAVS